MQTEQAINSGKPHILKFLKVINQNFLRVRLNRSQNEQFRESILQIPNRSNNIIGEAFSRSPGKCGLELFGISQSIKMNRWKKDYKKCFTTFAQYH